MMPKQKHRTVVISRIPTQREIIAGIKADLAKHGEVATYKELSDLAKQFQRTMITKREWELGLECRKADGRDVYAS